MHGERRSDCGRKRGAIVDVIADRILAAIARHPGATIDEIAIAARASRRTVCRRIRVLRGAGVAITTGPQAAAMADAGRVIEMKRSGMSVRAIYLATGHSRAWISRVTEAACHG